MNFLTATIITFPFLIIIVMTITAEFYTACRSSQISSFYNVLSRTPAPTIQLFYLCTFVGDGILDVPKKFFRHSVLHLTIIVIYAIISVFI